MRRLVLLVVVATALAACNGGGNDRTARSTTTTTTAPGASTSTTAAPNLDAVSVTLTKVADVKNGTALVARSGDSALYVAQQTGEVVAIRDGQVDAVLDISGRIRSGGEQGLLGIVFSPDGSKLYAHSSARNGDTRLEEYAFTPATGGGGRADPSTARLLLDVAQPQPNHNGGQLAFDPDGMLYLGLGDGGGSNDEGSGHAAGGNAQYLNTLLGKILRIDPMPDGATGKPYTIPADNPFANGGGRPEIWAYGLRNPWRFSYDLPTNALWIGDVGQNAVEEINALPIPESRGANFGWNRLEGTKRFRGNAPADAIAPVFETSHDDGNCSVIGGSVYRGQRIPNLVGAYLFSDYCNGTIRALRIDGRRVVAERDLGISANDTSSFGVGHDGELYVLSLGDGVFRIDPK